MARAAIESGFRFRASMPTMTSTKDPFSAYATLDTAHGKVGYYRLDALRSHCPQLEKLPFSIRVLLESLLRNCDGFIELLYVAMFGQEQR